jgi:hypothetical protein
MQTHVGVNFKSRCNDHDIHPDYEASDKIDEDEVVHTGMTPNGNTCLCGYLIFRKLIMRHLTAISDAQVLASCAADGTEGSLDFFGRPVHPQ